MATLLVVVAMGIVMMAMFLAVAGDPGPGRSLSQIRHQDAVAARSFRWGSTVEGLLLVSLVVVHVGGLRYLRRRNR